MDDINTAAVQRASVPSHGPACVISMELIFSLYVKLSERKSHAAHLKEAPGDQAIRLVSPCTPYHVGFHRVFLMLLFLAQCLNSSCTE